VATLALEATVESLVTDVRYPVLIHFPIIAQCSKGVHYFHRVVGLVVLSVSIVRHTVSCWILTVEEHSVQYVMNMSTASDEGRNNCLAEFIICFNDKTFGQHQFEDKKLRHFYLCQGYCFTQHLHTFHSV